MGELTYLRTARNKNNEVSKVDLMCKKANSRAKTSTDTLIAVDAYLNQTPLYSSASEATVACLFARYERDEWVNASPRGPWRHSRRHKSFRRL